MLPLKRTRCPCLRAKPSRSFINSWMAGGWSGRRAPPPAHISLSGFGGLHLGSELTWPCDSGVFSRILPSLATELHLQKLLQPNRQNQNKAQRRRKRMGYLVYFVFVFVFPDKVSLCSSGTSSIDKTQRDLPVPTSRGLGLKVWGTSPRDT